MIAHRVVIAGRVQGVGFREAMVTIAQRVGVSGWVRNRYDGTVEAWLQGEATAVEHVLAWCRRGPPLARVSDLQVLPAEPDPDRRREFERRPSA